MTDTTTREVPLAPIPGTYVYVGQLQAASVALARALDALSDQHYDGAVAAEAVVETRQRIENIYRLQADGITS